MNSDRNTISIIDYGIGNYASLHGMFNRLNCLSKVTSDKKIIKKPNPNKKPLKKNVKKDF